VLDRTGDVAPGLLVVPVGGGWPAALAVAALVDELVGPDAQICVVDCSDDGVLAGLRNHRRRGTSAEGSADGGSGTVRVLAPAADLDAGGDDWPSDGAPCAAGKGEVVLVMSALDPRVGAYHLRPWASTAVAVVTAGRSTPVALRSAGQMLRAAGIDLASAVLVGADRGDETLGVGPGPAARPVTARTIGSPNGWVKVGDTPSSPAPGSGS
jgi:hypothetical protein